MARRTKPLEVVRTVRDDAVEAARIGVRDAERLATTAREEAAQARAREQAVKAEVRARAEAESRALTTGASARDFAQLAAWEVAAQASVDRAVETRTTAERTARAADAKVDARRSELGQAKTALEIVERHQATIVARETARAAAAIDEAAEEAHAARFRNRTNG